MPEKSKSQSNKRYAPDFSPGQHIIAICLFLVQAMVMFFLGVLVGKYQPSSFYHLKEEAAPVSTVATAPANPPGNGAGAAQAPPAQRRVYEMPAPQKAQEPAPVKVVPPETKPAETAAVAAAPPAPAPGAAAPPAPAPGAAAPPAPAPGAAAPPAPAPGAAEPAAPAPDAAPLPAGTPTAPTVVAPAEKAAPAPVKNTAAPPEKPVPPTSPDKPVKAEAKTSASPPADTPQAASTPLNEEAPLLEGVEPVGAKTAAAKKDAAPGAAPAAAGSVAGGKFVIQVASLAGAERKKQAEVQLRKLEKQTGLKGAVLQANGDKSLRIVIGDFADRASAMKKCEELRKQPEFSGCFVRQR